MNDADQDDAVERVVDQLEGIPEPDDIGANAPRRVATSINFPMTDQSGSDDPSSAGEATHQRQTAAAPSDSGSPEHPGATETLQPGAERPPRDPRQQLHVQDLRLADAGVNAPATDHAESELGAATPAMDSQDPNRAAPDSVGLGAENTSPEVNASVLDVAVPEAAASVLDTTGATGVPPGAAEIAVASEAALAPAEAPAPEHVIEPETEAEGAPSALPQFEPVAPVQARDMTRRLSTRLGQLLVDSGKLSDAQLQTALRRQQETGERLGEVLVKDGYIDEPALLSVLERQYGVPAAVLDEEELDTALAKLIPFYMANRYLLVPLALHAEAVDVAMVDPTDFVAMAHVRFATGVRPNVFVTTVTAVRRAIATLYAGEAADMIARPREREAVKRMIRDRDSIFIAAKQDGRKLYELAASLDAFVDEIFRKVTETG